MTHTQAITIIQKAIADGRFDTAEHRRIQTQKLDGKVFKTYTDLQIAMNQIDIDIAIALTEQKQLFQ